MAVSLLKYSLCAIRSTLSTPMSSVGWLLLSSIPTSTNLLTLRDKRELKSHVCSHQCQDQNPPTDDTALWAASKNVQFAAKLLQKDLRKLAKRCAKSRIKLNPEKT